MHRIDCPTATPDNKFTEGDPTIPVAATTVTADWLNAVQEELAAVIASAELTLDKANNAQLLQALHKILDIRAPLATLLRAGLMQPDGATTQVNEEGLLSALGGNLLLNDAVWITESGTFTAPVTGWYAGEMWTGGYGAVTQTVNGAVIGGVSGSWKRFFVYLTAGQQIPVVVGTGGLGIVSATTSTQANPGGDTSFGDITVSYDSLLFFSGTHLYTTTGTHYAKGGGIGAHSGAAWSSSLSQAQNNARQNAYGHCGAGGTAIRDGNNYAAGAGAQGSIYLCWHDPAKAAGPLPTPALLSARRMASRAAAAPVTVNLYDPETGQGSVWREEDAEAKLAEGLITEAAWQENCAAKAAEERAAWLADPDTEAERFELLRMACEAKLTATDKLTTADYPISDEDRAAVNAYRKAIRELNHQRGAPWDGGGELTPWPEMPAITKVQEA